MYLLAAVVLLAAVLVVVGLLRVVAAARRFRVAQVDSAHRAFVLLADARRFAVVAVASASAIAKPLRGAPTDSVGVEAITAQGGRSVGGACGQPVRGALTCGVDFQPAAVHGLSIGPVHAAAQRSSTLPAGFDARMFCFGCCSEEAAGCVCDEGFDAVVRVPTPPLAGVLT